MRYTNITNEELLKDLNRLQLNDAERNWKNQNISFLFISLKQIKPVIILNSLSDDRELLYGEIIQNSRKFNERFNQEIIKESNVPYWLRKFTTVGNPTLIIKQRLNLVNFSWFLRNIYRLNFKELPNICEYVKRKTTVLIEEFLASKN